MTIHACGICGEEATVGPFAGGPVPWYCTDCHWKIRKFLKKLEELKELHKKLRKQRKK